MPYLITDRVVAPESCQHCYSEQLAYMPNCYFVNDYKAAHQDVLDEANLPTRCVSRASKSVCLSVCMSV